MVNFYWPQQSIKGGFLCLFRFRTCFVVKDEANTSKQKKCVICENKARINTWHERSHHLKLIWVWESYQIIVIVHSNIFLIFSCFCVEMSSHLQQLTSPRIEEKYLIHKWLKYNCASSQFINYFLTGWKACRKSYKSTQCSGIRNFIIHTSLNMQI